MKKRYTYSYIKLILINSSAIFFISGLFGLILNFQSTGKPYYFRWKSSRCVSKPLDPVFGFKQNSCLENPNIIGFDKELKLENIKKNENEINSPLKILVIGGSVANHLSVRADFEDLLNKRISNEINSPIPKQKFVRIFNAALGGAKQPQGLQSYLALELLGYKFDAIIELSGFNEVALNLVENKPNNINPIYPRLSSLQYLNSSKKLASNNLSLLFENLINLHPLHQYIVNQTSIYSTIRIYILEKNSRPKVSRLVGMNYLINSKDEDFFSDSMEIYSRSIKKINYLAKESGAEYILALQPVQYIKDSKQFTKEELDLICTEKNEKTVYKLLKQKMWCTSIGEITSKFYPKISLDILKKETGVKNMIDLRNIFINTKQTVYDDTCCHMNRFGMTMIADAITEELVRNTNFLRKLYFNYEN